MYLVNSCEPLGVSLTSVPFPLITPHAVISLKYYFNHVILLPKNFLQKSIIRQQISMISFVWEFIINMSFFLLNNVWVFLH